MPKKNNVNHQNLDVMWRDLKGFAKEKDLSLDDVNIFRMLNLPFPSSYPDEIAYYTNPKEWSPLETYVSCYLKKKEITDDPNCFRNTGRSAGRYKTWGNWKETAKSLAGPAVAINLLPEMVPSWNDTKIFEVIDPARYRLSSKKIGAVIKYTFHPHIEPSDDYCSDPHILGLLEAIPTNFPKSLFKFWESLPLGYANQTVSQYDPIKLFNSVFFEHMNLNPTWDGLDLYITNPNTGYDVKIGQKVILKPSELNGKEHFLGKYQRITSKPSENDKVGTLIDTTMRFEGEEICSDGTKMGAPSFIINYSCEDMKINKRFWYIRSIFGNMSLVDDLIEQNLQNAKIIDELEDRVDEQTRELTIKNEELQDMYNKLEKAKEMEDYLNQQLRIQDVLQTGEDIGAQILHENKNLLTPLVNLVTRVRRLMDVNTRLVGYAKTYATNGEAKDIRNLEFLMDALKGSLSNAETAYTEIMTSYEHFKQVYNPKEEGRNDLNRDLEACVNLMVDRNYRPFIDVELDVSEVQVPQTYESSKFNKGIFIDLFKNARDAIVIKKEGLEKTESKEYKGKLLVRTIQLDDKTKAIIYDNGIGVPEGYEDIMFNKRETTKNSGTGLGLYTARFILDELKCGRIYYEKSDLPDYNTKMVVELNLK